ncbi:MAG: hypothetical protein CVU61_08570 [Deltaproteobacteria bacterium HGW-Deltaproteobacteria-19]|nr:MAG: hypothetical protein CVU61_08570 [Deltaproteobacteria bacterium HGW-Deltaproteobacteria-19]
MQVYVPDCLRAEELFRLRTRDAEGNLRKRFNHLVETTDWDRELSRLERAAGPACWGVIGLSLLYFIPFCLSLLLA